MSLPSTKQSQTRQHLALEAMAEAWDLEGFLAGQ